jgi:hypothetical protein
MRAGTVDQAGACPALPLYRSLLWPLGPCSESGVQPSYAESQDLIFSQFVG